MTGRTEKEGDIKTALIKKALGYDAKEIVEEYSLSDEGEIKLLKKKVTTKNVPPDTTALKMLLDVGESEYSEMTDEELIKEKERLISQLKKNK